MTKDEVHYTDTYVTLHAMPSDGIVRDGTALIGSTLYLNRRPLGRVLGVNARPFMGGHRIDYFVVTP
ncbi:hypothetical protein VSS74_14185 [Conexibacter stalactiti]|uniref:3D domain-containing protein n=1 Tax=Conexibacter stalactiti TaxID=1940611 RepID=A0ABU4HQJ1_9ACTN|nr:hypothetical protein [Conexibacter stalactiti]MDW5595494.1 hypothetical protein [Conexibacter stalactiti]MEC5036136.1 hypothetical protein [Conexibacter stalactiti]